MQVTERNKDGGSRADDNALALLPVFSPSHAIAITDGSGMNNDAQQQKVAMAWTMMPWHCLPFLTLLGDGNHGSGAKDGAQQQQWQQYGQWCLDIVGRSLLAYAKALMVAAWMMVYNNGGG